MTTNKFYQNKKGFTLIETLIAISILLIAVVGPISIIGDANHKLYYARDQMIAINLAQEGVEVVRQLRDSNMLAGTQWDGGFAVGSYIVDPLAGTPLNSNVTDQKIYIDSSSGLYRQGVGFSTPTQFSRIVTVASVPLVLNERKITSTVTWNTGGNAGTVVSSEDLFKWTLP